jgi:hypothetical protein
MTELTVKGLVTKVTNIATYDNEGWLQLGKLVKDALSTGTLRITKIQESRGKYVRDVLVIEAQ